MVRAISKHTICIVILLLLGSFRIVAQVNFTSSNIPLIIIETNGKEIMDDPRVLVDMKVINNKEKRNHLSDSVSEYNGKINIEIRGSSSQSFPKKQYAFETQNEDGNTNNVSLLDLPIENDWILSAPYSDKTLIRNILAYKLSESLGHYAPRTKLCEVVLNSEYLGVFVLTEKIKRDKNRVDIAKLKPDEVGGDDLTGGYILKIDKSTGNNCYGWRTDVSNVYVQNEYPDCKDIANEQKLYIKNYVNSFEDVLFSDNYSDTNNGYQEYINLNAALDYLIVNETSNNIDAYRLSTFIYKDKESNGGKLNFGPVWDFNLAFGNANYRLGYKTDELIAPNHPWWNRLLQDSIFNTKLIARWNDIRKSQFSNERILFIIDSLHLKVNEAQNRNFQKWDVHGKKVWPNYYVGQSYENEIYFLKTWVINRLNWLDTRFLNYYEVNLPFTDYESSVFPNPFDYFITYGFTLSQSGKVSIRLFDSSGRWITNIVQNLFYEAGKHKIVWNSFVNKNRFSNSVYFIELEVDGEKVAQEKIIKKY